VAMAVDALILNRITVALNLIPIKIKKENMIIEETMCFYIIIGFCYIRAF
jgi:hypothetical protein